MRRARVILAPILLGAAAWLLLGGCGDRTGACLEQVAAAPDGAYVRLAAGPNEELRLAFRDGAEISVPRAPQRIVSALPGITEMVVFLGGGPQLVAVSPHCDHPASIRDLPRVRVQPFDPEGVVLARPDLVIVDRRLHRRDLGVIRRRVSAVLPLETSRSVAHLATSIEVLAAVLDTPEARDRALRWRARMKNVVQRIAAEQPSRPPRVLCAWGWDPLYALGPGSLLDDLLRICGCVNVACDLKSDASGTFPEELVLQRRPDWILTAKEGMPARLLERWHRLPAVAEGRVAEASADDLQRAGPRILDGLERLAAVLHGRKAVTELTPGADR